MPHNDNISVIIHTCDEYSHFWDGWFTMFDHFRFLDLGWPIYFCNEEIKVKNIGDPKSGNGCLPLVYKNKLMRGGVIDL